MTLILPQRGRLRQAAAVGGPAPSLLPTYQTTTIEATATTQTLVSHQVESGTDILVVCVGLNDGASPSDSVSSVVFNGSEAFTKAGHIANSNARAEIWYLLNPTVTTADVVVTMSAVVDRVVFSGAYNVADASTVAAVSAGQSISTTTITSDAISATGASIVFGVATQYTGETGGNLSSPNLTELFDGNAPSGTNRVGWAGYTEEASSVSSKQYSVVNASATWPSTRSAFIVAAFQ